MTIALCIKCHVAPAPARGERCEACERLHRGLIQLRGFAAATPLLDGPHRPRRSRDRATGRRNRRK